ncbi:MAG: hypothetical protein H6837_08795 [Planctomycetes bacterium]|nr:hypothetical protein [Planctomycetota bacterium]
MRILPLVLSGCASLCAQSPRDLSACVPPDTLVLVDACDGGALARGVLKLLQPLRRAMPPELRVALGSLPLATKAFTGHTLDDLLEVMLPSQVALAVLPGARRPRIGLLARVEEGDEVRRVLARLGAAGKAKFDLSDGILTLASSDAALAHLIAHRRSGRRSLLGDTAYRSARPALEPGRTVRVYANLSGLRALARGKTLWERLDPGGRVLVGPVLRVADRATRLHASLRIGAGGVDLRCTFDSGLEGDSVARLRACGAEPRLLPAAPEGTIARVALDRDFGLLLTEPDAWLGEDGALGVKQLRSFAGLLLGGASLTGDLLPRLRQPADLLVTANSPSEDDELPRIVLPAFTLVFAVDGEARVRRQLEQAMAMLVTVSNPKRIRERQVPWMVRDGRLAGYAFRSLRLEEFRGVGAPPLAHGLSPTLLFAHGHGIVSSTIDGAVRAAQALAGGKPEKVVGDVLRLQGAALAKLLRANFDPLVTQRTLAEGESRPVAAAWLRGVLAVVEALDLEVAVEPAARSTVLRIAVRRSAR